LNASEETRVTVDLTRQSEAKGCQDTPVRRVTLIVVGLFAIFLALILTKALSPGNLSTPLEWIQFAVLVPGLSAMLVLMLFAAWKFGPGATSISVASVGLLFVWRSGQSDRLAWEHLPQRLVLLDYTINPTLPRLSGNLWEVRRWNRPACYLTKEAFDAISVAAPSHGLQVEATIPSRTDFSRNFWGWAQCRIIRFKGLS
jgi:hypothetical protein